MAQPDGKVIIVGAGIDRIMASQFPWSQAQLSVFLSLQGEGEQDQAGTEHDIRIRILTPTGDVIGELGAPFQVSSAYADVNVGHALQNAALVFQQVQFPAEGIYRVEIVVDGTVSDGVDLNVVHGMPPQQVQWQGVPVPPQPAPG